MAAKKVDINKATIEDFETLAGIGHAKAEAILEARQNAGGFHGVSDLLEIPGIGPGLLEQNRGLLTCGRIPSTRIRSGDKNRSMDPKPSSSSYVSSPIGLDKIVPEKSVAGPSQSRSSHNISPTENDSHIRARTSGTSDTSTRAKTSTGPDSRGKSSTAADVLHRAKTSTVPNTHAKNKSASGGETDSETNRGSCLRRKSCNLMSLRSGSVRGCQVDSDKSDSDSSDLESSEGVPEDHTDSLPSLSAPDSVHTDSLPSLSAPDSVHTDSLPSLSAPDSVHSPDINMDCTEDSPRSTTSDEDCDPHPHSDEQPHSDDHGLSDDHVTSDDPGHSDDIQDAVFTGPCHSSEKPSWMKRKSDGESTTETSSGKKPCRLRSKPSASDYPEYDSAASLRSCLAALSASNNASAIRKQRIPSKNNPPPQLSEWLKTFQVWSHAERLLALDELIELCEPTQVRHLMAVIEPQFQRDFISLLPKELALYVLSFLDPRDLLRAAQTCRYWRVLAEDNLLWREKCREESIDEATVFENRIKRKSDSNTGPSAKSPWKNLYLRQKSIEHNWRASPIRPPKVLKGHDDHVITCLEFSGTKVVSGSDDNTLKVWSAVTGKCLRTLVGHTGGVWSSQMAGNVIISGSTDRTLKVWNADTGQCTYTLYGHTSTVRCMHLNKDKVVSGSRDATLRLWNVDSGQCLHVLMGHMAAIRCVQYDGKRVVSGAYDYTVRVWDPDTESCIHILNGHTNRVYSLQFDGVHIVSGSLDTSIRVWDVENGNCLHTLIGHQSLTSGMELKDNILVSGNADSTVKVWDITTGQCLQTLQGTNKHQSAVTCLQFNKKFVITSSDDGSVKIWDLKAGDFLRNLVALDSGGSGGVVWRIRCSNTKLVCAVGSRNGTEETKLLVLDFDVEDSETISANKSVTALKDVFS